MEEQRKSQRRVTSDRRKGPRRVKHLSVGIERRTTGERRKGERRTIPDRRVEAAKLNCPVCRENIVGFEPMRNHLIDVHGISDKQATFLTKKMIEWKQEKLDPTLYP